MDMSTDAVWDLFSLFNFSVQLSYDRLSFDASDIVFFSCLTLLLRDQIFTLFTPW